MAGNSHDRLCKRVSNVKLMPCHLASIILIVLYCCLWCKNAEAFVQLSLQRSALAATGCRATPAADAASATATSAALTVGIDYSRSSNWRTATSIRRKRRIRTAGRRAGSSGGVRSLKAAGLGFPPLPGSEMIDYVGRELAEQSVKHHWSSGFIGGSVGVMGTLTAIQIKINQVRELTACPYCRSSGQLPCATCYGIGSVSIPNTVASTNEVTTTVLTCPCCRGQTFITCVNCKGDGRGVPLFLNKKVSRDPESEIEDVGYA